MALGERVPEDQVSYEPPRSSAQVGSYYRIADQASVCWVLPSNLNVAGGYFALYEGSDDDYQPTVVESS